MWLYRSVEEIKCRSFPDTSDILLDTFSSVILNFSKALDQEQSETHKGLKRVTRVQCS